MTAGSALGDFLRARRSLLRPEDIGLVADSRRRVEGLRRSEVAERARISPDYYLRLEQGKDHAPSRQVLDSLSVALNLDPFTRKYLDKLAGEPTIASNMATGSSEDFVRLKTLISGWTHTVGLVMDPNLDVVDANALADRLFGGRLSPGANLLILAFEMPPKDRPADWGLWCARLVGALRMWSRPEDPRLHQIIGRLSLLSQDFRQLWAAHHAYAFESGTVQVAVAPFGTFELAWRCYGVLGHDGFMLTSVSAPPASHGAAALAALSAQVTPQQGRQER